MKEFIGPISLTSSMWDSGDKIIEYFNMAQVNHQSEGMDVGLSGLSVTLVTK
jgi:hypothetical protein